MMSIADFRLSTSTRRIESMSIKKGQQVELEITDLAFGGKGIARIDGLTVFVDQVAPSDRILARIIKKKKNYAEARVETVLEPSPLRVDPPCPYSGFCGGCKWQFIRYDMQIVYKHRHVVDSLEHIAMLKNVPVHATIASDRVFGYRNKMEFSCSDRRWMLPEELSNPDAPTGFALGLHVPGTYYKVLDTQACLLQPDLGNSILSDAREFMKNSAVPAYNLKNHTGFWRFLVLRHSVAHDQWMVNIVTATRDDQTIRRLADLIVNEHPKVVSVLNNITSRKSGVAVGDEEVLLAGKPILRDRIGPFEFEISANSFFQTNTRGARHLYDTVMEYAALTGTETALDLYSGAGAIAIYLADAAQTVFGIEISRQAIIDAENNCRLNQIDNCRFIQGDARNCLSQIGARPDVVIVDPPRAGMHKEVVEQILDMAPETIVYVSCNPATMARDLLMMKDSYRVVAVQPVDMFPHTFHIESVAKLEKI